MKNNLGEPLVLANSKPDHNAGKANLLLYPQYQEYATLRLDPCTVCSVSAAKKL